jgi:hypothetical protein
VTQRRHGNCLKFSLPCPGKISHINTNLPSTGVSLYFNLSQKSHEIVPSLAEHEQASSPTLLTYNPYTPHLKIAMREIRRTLGPVSCYKVTGYIGNFLSRMEWRCILFPDSTFHVTALYIHRHHCSLQKFQTTATTDATMKEGPVTPAQMWPDCHSWNIRLFFFDLMWVFVTPI